MNILTHRRIDQEFCGTPLNVKAGFSRVQLHTNERMAVDKSGLVHGGFIFGLADYSAMIAVNHPNVVLGAADVKFLKPVRVNDIVVAEAKVDFKEGKKYMVSGNRVVTATQQIHSLKTGIQAPALTDQTRLTKSFKALIELVK